MDGRKGEKDCMTEIRLQKKNQFSTCQSYVYYPHYIRVLSKEKSGHDVEYCLSSTLRRGSRCK